MAFNFSRYSIRRQFTNDSSRYFDTFVKKDINFINQYSTPTISYPSVEQIAQLPVHREDWKAGTRYNKLADQYYNDAELWWCIAWFNKKPLESDFNFGDIVLIPTPLERVLDYFSSQE